MRKTCQTYKSELVLLIVALIVALTLSVWPRTAHADSGPVFTTQTTTPTQPLDACRFSPGWNLVTLTGTPSALPACVNVAFGWLYEDARWEFWGRDNPAYWNDLTRFDIHRAYWVYVP